MAVIASLRDTSKARDRARGRRGLMLVATLIGAWVCACSAGPIDIAGLSPSTLRVGVVAHWPLDDVTGSRAADRSGNNHHGTATGGTWIQGRFGGALHFDSASGSQIVVAAFPQAATLGTAWSVALWVRPVLEDLGTGYATLLSTEITLVQNVHQGGGWQMNLQMNLSATPPVSQYQFGYWLGPDAGDYEVVNCQCVVPDQWTHVAAVADTVAGTLSFFANGVYQGSGIYRAGSAVNMPIKLGTQDLYVGRWATPGTRLFKGDLDDIVIYRRVLTAEEVAELARAAVPDPR